MDITSKVVNDVMIIKLHGQLNIDTSPQFREILFAKIDADPSNNKILIDCDLLEYVSSAGIQVLYILLDKLEQKDGKLALCSVSPNVKKVFNIIDLMSDIQIYKDQAEALTKLNS